MTDYLLLSLAIILLIGGFIGSVIPGLPGPPFAYLSLVVLHLTRFADFTPRFLLITGLVAAAATAIDWFVPMWGAKKFGGSKYGVIGAAIGLLVGLFFAPPGIIVGPFLGAFLLELLHKNSAQHALRAGVGSLIGFMFGTGIKLAIAAIFAYHFIKGVF